MLNVSVYQCYLYSSLLLVLVTFECCADECVILFLFGREFYCNVTSLCSRGSSGSDYPC